MRRGQVGAASIRNADGRRPEAALPPIGKGSDPARSACCRTWRSGPAGPARPGHSSTTPWPWKVRRHPPAERAGRSGDAPPFPPVPTGNRKIRPEAPPPSLQEGRFPSLRTARKGRKRRRFLSSCPLARLGRGNEPDTTSRAYEQEAPATHVKC